MLAQVFFLLGAVTVIELRLLALQTGECFHALLGVSTVKASALASSKLSHITGADEVTVSLQQPGKEGKAGVSKKLKIKVCQ